MRKKVWVGLALVGGTAVALAAVVLVSADALARKGLETASARALGVPTRLESVNLRFSGQATLGRLWIGNPPGFKEPAAASIEKMEAWLHPATLFRDEVDVDRLEVEDIELTVEFAGFRSNWSALMAHLAATRSDESSERSREGRTTRPGAKSYRIARLRVQGATVRLRSNLLPGGSHLIGLAPFELKDLGDAERGATPADVLSTLFFALAAHALGAGEGGVPAQLLGSFRSEVSKTAEELRRAVAAGARHLQQVETTLKDELRTLFEPNR